MSRCPLCETTRVLVVIDVTKRALCLGCGARWIQDGASRRRIQTPDADPATLPAR